MEIKPLNIAVLTVSDTRDEKNDLSGECLVSHLLKAGHSLHEKKILIDDVYQIRAQVSLWIAEQCVHAILITGGTGFARRDVTPEALLPLFDKEVKGFGELFRYLSYKQIGSASLQSRSVAGYANNTVIFALPGSTNACQTAWQALIAEQLDSTNRPCNFVNNVTCC